ncbi:MAG: hypothetical protein AAEJ04_02405 [Planctomycetota bacterium]
MLSLLLTLAMTTVAPMAETVPATEAYPLETCAVAGKKLGSMGKPIDYVHEGRQVRFCCRGCVPKFKSNPEQYLAAVDAKIIETQKKNYPTDTCLLSQQKLDNTAKEIVINNRLVRLCCGRCVKKIKADPQSIFKKLDAAILKAQAKSYPLTTCVISGEDLNSMGKPKDVIVGNTLIKVCCKGCVSKVTADPAKFIEMVQSAKKSGGNKEKKTAPKKAAGSQ